MAYLLIFVFLSLLLIVYMVYVAHHDTINNYTIYDERLPSSFNNFQIFFISDIHRRVINERTLQLITDEIDIVIIGGDLTEKRVPLERTKANIKKLKRWNVPLYFVWGNNDYEALSENIDMLLVKENVTILTNTNEDIKRGNSTISLLGLDCCIYREARLDFALQNAKGDYFILLTHAPIAFFDLESSDQDKIHTVLSGHTHGGQIRIFGFGPYERGGYKRYRDTNTFISEGYGYSKLPFRLGTKAECHVLTIKNPE